MAEQATQAAWTIGSLLKWTEDYLRGKSVESPRLDAQVLLAHVLKCSRPQLYVRFDEEPSPAARAEFRELIRRRVDGTPVAYLTGQKEFYLLSFEVTPDVLIPRPETETLVLATITELKGVAEPRVLDLCCGSGCVAIAIAHQLKKVRCVATDISPAAVELTLRNAQRYSLSDRIDTRVGDLYSPLRSDERFHAIVSNPPYIRTGDITSLAAEVRDHEPRQALDGGEDGFAIIERLIVGAANHLEPDGWLLFEIGAGQETDATTKLQAAGFETKKPIPDAAGIPRVVAVRKKT